MSSPLPQPDTSHAMLRVGGVVDVASNKRRAAGKLGSVLIRRYQQQHAGRAACGLQNTVPVICRRASGFQAAQAGPVCERWHHHGVSAAAVPAQEFARRIALPTLAARPLFGRASLNNGIISCQSITCVQPIPYETEHRIWGKARRVGLTAPPRRSVSPPRSPLPSQQRSASPEIFSHRARHRPCRTLTATNGRWR